MKKIFVTALRWISFLPAGFILGILCAIPIRLISLIGGWWENSFVLSLTHNAAFIYFWFLGSAWVVPKSCRLIGLKILLAIIFGLLLYPLTKLLFWSFMENDPLVWDKAGYVIGSLIGFYGAYFGTTSMKTLLKDVKGANPFNAHENQFNEDLN